MGIMIERVSYLLHPLPSMTTMSSYLYSPRVSHLLSWLPHVPFVSLFQDTQSVHLQVPCVPDPLSRVVDMSEKAGEVVLLHLAGVRGRAIQPGIG